MEKKTVLVTIIVLIVGIGGYGILSQNETWNNPFRDTTMDDPLTSISLVTNATTITVGDSVKFSFTTEPIDPTGYDGETYNIKNIGFYVNSTLIASNVEYKIYTFDKIGTYQGWVEYRSESTNSDRLENIISLKVTIVVNDIDPSLIYTVIHPSNSTKLIPQPSNQVDLLRSFTLTTNGETKTFSYVARSANGVNMTSGYFGLTSSYKVFWTVKDSSDNCVYEPGYYTVSIYVTLTIGETYSITIKEADDKGPVDIKIYAPNGLTDISGFTDIKDSLWFNNQKATYQYTPSRDGKYRMEMPYSVFWEIKDNYGNTISDNSYTIYYLNINLDSTKTYTIIIEEGSVTGEFNLKIHVPNYVIDVTGKQKIYDCMRYEAQSNSYKYTPSSTSSYSLQTSIKVYWEIKDSYGNTKYSSSSTSKSLVSISLNAGEKYTITLSEVSTMGNYSLIIKTTN